MRVGRYFLALTSPRAAIVTVILAILAKIALIATNEIVATPDDAQNYVTIGNGHLLEVGPPPGYPWWLALTRLTGLPQRLSIELLYLAACLFLLSVLRRRIGNSTSAMLFVAALFLPTTYHLFDEALSDGFYLCLTLFAVSIAIEILFAGMNVTRLVSLGAILGWMLVTRNENYLIVAFIAWLALGVFVLAWRSDGQTYDALRSAGIMAIALAVIAFAFPTTFAVFHSFAHGVSTVTISTMPSHMKLLQNLASIDTGEFGLRRIPITARQRAAAYAASPSVATLRPRIEDPSNPYQRASLESGLPAGEVGAGWIWHIVNDAALSSLTKRSVANLDAFYNAANQELQKAFDDGTLRRKFVLSPILGGGLGTIAASLPASISTVYALSYDSMKFPTRAGGDESLFNAVCLRREALIYRGAGLLGIWGWLLHAAAEPIATVEVGVYEPSRDASTAVWLPAELTERRDVAEAYRSSPSQAASGFSARIPNGTQGSAAVIRATLASGTKLVSEPLKAGTPFKIGSDRADGGVLVSVDAISERKASIDKWRMRTQAWLRSAFARVFPWIVPIVAFLAIVGAVIGRRRPDAPAAEVLAIVAIFTAGLYVQRLLFYALIEAAAWEVEVRYLAPATAMLLVSTVLAGRYAWNALASNVEADRPGG